MTLPARNDFSHLIIIAAPEKITAHFHMIDPLSSR